jgi:GTP-binding protein
MTKADKIKDHQMDKVLGQVRGALSKHPAAFPEIIVTSSEKCVGIDTLRSTIAHIQ